MIKNAFKIVQCSRAKIFERVDTNYVALRHKIEIIHKIVGEKLEKGLYSHGTKYTHSFPFRKASTVHW